MNPHYSEELIQKFKYRTAKIAVIGLGYVGLPPAVVFAEAGFNIMLIVHHFCH